jgi:hypothetical protein
MPCNTTTALLCYKLFTYMHNRAYTTLPVTALDHQLSYVNEWHSIYQCDLYQHRFAKSSVYRAALQQLKLQHNLSVSTSHTLKQSVALQTTALPTERYVATHVAQCTATITAELSTATKANVQSTCCPHAQAVVTSANTTSPECAVVAVFRTYKDHRLSCSSILSDSTPAPGHAWLSLVSWRSASPQLSAISELHLLQL